MNAIVPKNQLRSAVPAPVDARASACFVPDPLEFPRGRDALRIERFPEADALLVSKSVPGFDRDCVDRLSLLLRKIAAGALPELKYLAFDFSHAGEKSGEAAAGFDELAFANASLILDAPVISIAWARNHMAGADLDFALSCSMMVADRDARFCFDVDVASTVGVYASLAQKLGFVRAERLMENGEVLTAEQMRELCLVKHIVEPNEGIGGAERYVKQCARRHNASYSMFRAQRIAAPPVKRSALGSAERGRVLALGA